MTNVAAGTVDGLNLYSDRSHSVADDVLNFLPSEITESPEVNAELDQLVDLARSHGWREALERVYDDRPGLKRYVTTENRGIFLEVLPLNDDAVVFELGPGLGQLTTQLAARCRAVYGLEIVPQQAAFALERCRQEGHNNVFMAAGGHDCLLPYRDESYDVVVLNLVFEWCGSRQPDRPVIESQRKLLSEARRVLKGGGTLYLNTKNRFAITALTGKTSDSMRLPFAHLLPYRLVEWLDPIVRIRSGIPCRVHSHNALRRLITNAGFQNARSYWAAPEMRFPKRIVPTDAASIRKARRDPDFVQGPNRRVRMIMPWIPAGLVRHFTQGLMFVATKA